jgi:predicted dehydrogenase
VVKRRRPIVRPACAPPTRRLLRIAVIGLGRAAAHTLAALAAMPDARVVAGVDPAGAEAHARLDAGVPVYRDLRELPLDGLDVAIVATPTPSHVAVCRALLESRRPPPRILCEKPLATDLSGVEELLTLADRRGVRLEVLLHYVFCADVAWLRERWDALLAAHGPVVAFDSRFCDPKPDFEAAARALGDSWLDSGINALSVLACFVQLDRRIGYRSAGAAAVATIAFRSGSRSGTGRVETSWAAVALVKATQLRLADGTVVTLDHVGQSVLLDRGGSQESHGPLSANDPARFRYRAMLHRYLGDGRPALGRGASRHLHAVLSGAPAGEDRPK